MPRQGEGGGIWSWREVLAELVGRLLRLRYAGALDEDWQAHILAGDEAQRRGDLAEAEKHFAAALKRAKHFRKGDSRLDASFTYLAMLYREQKRYKDAEALLEVSLARLEKSVGRGNPAFATVLGMLANVYRAEARYDEAEPLLVHTLKILEGTLGRHHPDVARVLEDYAGLLRDMGRDGEAAPMEDRARSIRRDWAKQMRATAPSDESA